MSQSRRRGKDLPHAKRRRGDQHPHAKLSDHEVELIRALAAEALEQGRRHRWVWQWLAEKFETHPRTIRKYVYFESRVERDDD